MLENNQRELTRNTLAIVLIGALLAACFWILTPFLPALIWSSMIVVATWPLLVVIQNKVRGRRPAVMIMIGLLVLVFVIPFTLAVGTIAEKAPQIAAIAKQMTHIGIPAPPQWVEPIPFIGAPLAKLWLEVSTTAPEVLAERFSPYVRDTARWMVAQAGSFGMMFLHLLLTLFLATILYMNGEVAASMMLRLSRRIAGERGENSAHLAALSVRAVAQGVVITALAQALLAGIGLAVVGIPYASLLTALTFMLTIAQIGAGPVLIPAIVWLFWSGSTGWGIAMLVWSVFVMGMDGFLRPYLIRRNANLPLLLIFAGVIGGLIAFGVIGLFIGPVLLAVCYTLMLAWINEDEGAEPTP